MKARHKRIAIVVVSLAGISLAMGLVFFAMKFASYFVTPTELQAMKTKPNQTIRLGGMVAEKSLRQLQDGLTKQFTVTDKKNSIEVVYKGILPDLFKEGQGVVADGAVNAQGVFIASEVLAKHDENYMPPEIQASMDKNKPQDPLQQN